MLTNAFRPVGALVVLRADRRSSGAATVGCLPAQRAAQAMRATWPEQRAAHMQHMQKALPQMNLPLARVLRDITCACDTEIERQFSVPKSVHDDNRPPLDTSAKRNTHSQHQPPYDARTLWYPRLGVHGVAVPDLNASPLETLIAAIGTPMSRFPTVKAVCAGLGVAPQNDISGGNGLRRRPPKTHHRAGQALRLTAQSVNRTPSAFGAFFRRMRAKHGPQKAIGATAHQIARTLYVMLNRRTPFTDIGADEYEQRERGREIARWRRAWHLSPDDPAPQNDNLMETRSL